jgi:hypothetical protein
MITDLENSNLAIEKVSWGSPSTSTCNGTQIVGGALVFGTGVQTSKTYTSLPAHDIIFFSIDIWRMDSWDPGDYVAVILDTTEYRFESPAYGIATTNMCGQTYHMDNGIFTAIIHQNHTNSSLVVKVRSGLDQGASDESYGFRNVKIIFTNVRVNTTYGVWTVSNKILPLTYTVPCIITHYYYNSSYLDCDICHDSCLNCTGMTMNECTSCNPGFYLSQGICLPCNSTCYTCTGPSIYNCTNCTLGKFLFPNGQCLPDCPITPTFGSIIKCNFTCLIGQYLYPNNTCRSYSCVYGFTEVNGSASGGVCLSQCGNLFRYDNRSCLSLCSFPFTTYTLFGQRFCQFPCSQNEFYYQNNSCLGTCEFPFYVINISVSSYCNYSCSLGQHIFTNGTCSLACNELGFSGLTVGLSKFCLFACKQDEYFFNKTCVPSCSSPLVPLNVSVGGYCTFPCSDNTKFYYHNGSCLTTCRPQFSTFNTTVGLVCEFPCPPNDYLYRNNSCLSTCMDHFDIINTTIGLICESPCGSTDYLYHNQSCLSSCPDPFIPYNTTVGMLCNFPCENGSFYFSNQTCQSTCSPLFDIINTTVGLICEFPCSSNQFLYANQSCLSRCPSPFHSFNTTVGLLCEFPCPTSTFYFRNQTCLQACLFPFYTLDVNVGTICEFPCKMNEFYYQNSSCFSICGPSYNVINVSVGYFCSFKCQGFDFLFYNDKCTSNCSYPYTPITIYDTYYCTSRCQPHEYLDYDNNICLPSCASPRTIDSTSFKYLNICLAAPDPQKELGTQISNVVTKMVTGSITATTSMLSFGFDPFAALAVMTILQNFYFTLFYNVNYPVLVREILGTFGVAVFNFLPNPVYWFVDPVPDLPSPKNFRDNNFTGYFFYSAFQSLLVIFFVIIVYLWGFTSKYLRKPRLYIRVGKLIRRNLNKSIKLRIFISVYLQLLITSMLQLRISDFSQTAHLVAYICATIVFFLCLGLPLFAFYLLSNSKSFAKLKEYDVFIEDYDLNNPKAKLFGFYIIFKRTILGMSLVLLYFYPIFQCLLPWLSNAAIIILILKLKPHQRPLLNVFELVAEVGFLSIHSSVLALAIMDAQGILAQEARNMAGYILLISIAVVFLCSMICIWAENIRALRKVIVNLRLVLAIRLSPELKYRRDSFVKKQTLIKTNRMQLKDGNVIKLIKIQRIEHNEEILEIEKKE